MFFRDGNYDVQSRNDNSSFCFTAKETEFTVTDGLGTYTCYVYYENGTDSGETTTVDPDAPTTTAPKTSASAPSAPVGVVANINDFNKLHNSVR